MNADLALIRELLSPTLHSAEALAVPRGQKPSLGIAPPREGRSERRLRSESGPIVPTPGGRVKPR